MRIFSSVALNNNIRSILAAVCAFAATIHGADANAIERVSMSAEQVDGSAFRAKQVRASISVRAPMGELRVAAREFATARERWNDVELLCAKLQVHNDRLACAQARLRAGATQLPLTFSLSTAPALVLILQPQPGETWQVDADFGGAAPSGQLKLVNAQLERLGNWLTAEQPRPSKGRADGVLTLSPLRGGASMLSGTLSLADVAFSDAASARLGEGLAGCLSLDANTERDGAWRWRADLALTQGELFWTPLYIQQMPARINASGVYGAQGLREVALAAQLSAVGALDAKLRFGQDGESGGEVRATDIDLAGAYAALGKQLLEQPGGAQYQVSGRGSFALRYGADGAQSAYLKLRDAAIADDNGRLKLRGISADLPWVNGRDTQGVVRISGGELWGLPLANVEANAQMNGYKVLVPRLTVDVLDGIFAINDLQINRPGAESNARRGGDSGGRLGAAAWQWELTAGLTPISLQKLSKQLKWPELTGSVAGVVPRLRYANNELRVDGNVLFNVFGGNVLARNLSMRDPLGAQPVVRGDVEMRKLDLGVLTRTYSFGHIDGLIDVDVKGVELRNWKPVRFDARVASSAGDYPRRISQQAVQNLSALGGAGATAALQRSLLRFFETFRYRRLGLTCELRDSICRMGGVTPARAAEGASARAGGYVIVEGGGIPAITVIGYNQSVSWQELLERVRRVTQGNSKAVVK